MIPHGTLASATIPRSGAFSGSPERIRLVHYIQDCGEGLPYYVNELSRLRALHGWTLGEVYWPHDGRVREWGSGLSRIEQFKQLTHEYPKIITRMGVDDGINAVRALLPHCEFDAAACSEGLKALRSYRKEWDEERGVWRDKPRHDGQATGRMRFAAWRAGIVNFEAPPETAQPQEPAILHCGPGGKVVYSERFSILEWANKRAKRRAAEA